MTFPDLRLTTGDTRRAVAAAGAVALVAGLLALPPALGRWWLSEDGVEHLAIAQSLVHGTGFVDPVQWYFYLDNGVPLPAFSVRAPVFPILAAIPLWLGATLSSIAPLHAVWASLIAGAIVLVARRSMRLPAATAAALLLCLSPGWLVLSRRPWNEITGLGAYLAVLITAPGILRSPAAALLCSAATALAWLTRPNLGAVALAVSVAVIWEVGARRALRLVPLWTYLAGFAASYAIIQIAVRTATGLAPYAGYGAMWEFLRSADGFSFQKEYVGIWSFIQSHFELVLEAMRTRASSLAEALCTDSKFHYVGWLAPVAIGYGLLRRRDGVLAHRINALSTLGFGATVVLNYAVFDPNRYPFMVAACATLTGIAALDAAAMRWETRRPEAEEPSSWGKKVPVVLVGATFLIAATTFVDVGSMAFGSWQSYRAKGTIERVRRSLGFPARQLCPWIPADAIVAAPRPWAVTLWCGNAAVVSPPDLAEPEWQRRFIQEKHVEYFLSNGNPVYAWLLESDRVRPITASRYFILYKVRELSVRPHRWQPPPPIVCAGRGSECLRELGR